MSRAGADRRTAPGTDLRTDVLIVGAGIAGAVLAFELARRGVDCILVDRTAPGAGASGVPAALINPHRGRSARASAADLEGARAFWELAGALEGEVGYSGATRSGVLRIADQERQARAWQRLAGPRWLAAREVPPEYHAPFGALLVETGGWVDPARLLGALVEAARRRGARCLFGAEFTGCDRPGERGTAASGARLDAHLLAPVLPYGGADLADQLAAAPTHRLAARRCSCRALVLATGAWRGSGVRLPAFELVWGEARVLELGFTPPYPLAGSTVAAFHAGRATVTGGHRPVGSVAARPAAGDEDPSQLQRALAWRLPGAERAAELSRWEGVRALRPSGEPVARRLCPGVYLLGAFGGRGFLRAAAVGARLAERLAARLGPSG